MSRTYKKWSSIQSIKSFGERVYAVVKQQLVMHGHQDFSFGGESSLQMDITLNFAVCGRSPEDQQQSLWAKGDPDNFCKFVQDALQGGLYDNDKQLVEVNCTKLGWVGLKMGFTRVEIKRCRLSEIIHTKSAP